MVTAKQTEYMRGLTDAESIIETHGLGRAEFEFHMNHSVEHNNDYDDGFYDCLEHYRRRENVDGAQRA